MDENTRTWTVQFSARVGALEAQPARFDTGAGGGRGKRGYQLRVPNPNCWKLDRLKDNTHGFHARRKSFDLQVRSVWAGVDKILEAMRDEAGVVDASVYAHLKSVQFLVPEGSGVQACLQQIVYGLERLLGHRVHEDHR